MRLVVGASRTQGVAIRHCGLPETVCDYVSPRGIHSLGEGLTTSRCARMSVSGMCAGRTGLRRIFDYVLAAHTASRTNFRGGGVRRITKFYAADLLTTICRLHTVELHLEGGPKGLILLALLVYKTTSAV